MKRSNWLESLLAQWPAKIISLAAAVILFMLYHISTLEEKFFSVPIKILQPRGLAIATPYPHSARITMRGEADKIFSIEAADMEVVADLSRYSSEGQFRVPLQLIRRSAALEVEALEMRMEPAEIKVRLEFQQVKSLKVAPRLKGLPAHGYELVQYTIRPSIAEAAGPRSQLQGLNSLRTEEIDLAGRAEDFSLKVKIVPESDLIDLPAGGSVEFRGVIREAEVIRTFEPLEMVSIDLPPGLKVAAPLPQGGVKLQGTQIAVESLNPSQIRLLVDCADIAAPGEYSLQVKADLPTGFMVLDYYPKSLTLSFLRTAKEEKRE